MRPNKKRRLLTAGLLWGAALAAGLGESEILKNGTVRLTGEALEYRDGKTVAAGKVPKWGMYEVRSTIDGATTLVAGTQYFSESGPVEVTVEGKAEAVELVPAPEGEAVVQQEGEGVVLLAKDATAWGRLLRYEPKTEKNCLGYWVDADDWATWRFELVTPGTYVVAVVQGCGTGQGGSEVVLEMAGQRLPFKVRDTGGFQVWEVLPVGEVTFASAGEVEAALRAEKKVAQAVMDVQKIVLSPVAARD